MKACIFVRVSTDEQEQQNQIPECRALCEREGWQVAEVIEARGVSGAAEMPREKLAVMDGVMRRKWDRVVVWSLDRWTRLGPLDALKACAEIASHGAQLVSVKEPFLSDPLIGKLLIAVLAWVAEWERRRRIDRTRAGLMESKRKLKELGSYVRFRNGQHKIVDKLGRPAAGITREQLAEARALRTAGVSWKQLPRAAKIPYDWTTLRKFVIGERQLS